ncbi:MAG TPA: sulfotransferase [Parafilimonas sp.]|nr:sulfotransferase [Parafilimonas sp.]
MTEKITVIYIISDRRSGSTLLENMLSKSEEIISVGELAMLKGHIDKQGPGIFWNWNCSCGKPVLECEFWNKVLNNIYDDNFQTKTKWPFKSTKITVASFFPKSACKTLWKFINTQKNFNTINTLNEIYQSVSSFSSKKIIVDSSKDPMQALAISKCKNIISKYIWLKRDTRAITYSKMKRAKINKNSDKRGLRTLAATLFFKKICASAVRCLKKYSTLTISYEALAANPQQELDKICNYFGVKNYTAPGYMELSNDHTIGGTPGRFERRPVAEDTTWKIFYANRPILNLLGKFANRF